MQRLATDPVSGHDRGRTGADAVAAELLAHPLGATMASRGLKPTRQRLAVYEVLYATSEHPTADELHRKLDGPEHPIALATVYNVLEALAEVGLCRAISSPGSGSRRWDAEMGAHVHVRRPGSQELVDVPDDLGRRMLAAVPLELVRELERRMGVTVAALEIEVVAEA